MNSEQIVAVWTRTDSGKVYRPVSSHINIVHRSLDGQIDGGEGREGIEDGLECGNFVCIHCGLAWSYEANREGCAQDDVEDASKAILIAVECREAHRAANEAGPGNEAKFVRRRRNFEKVGDLFSDARIIVPIHV